MAIILCWWHKIKFYLKNKNQTDWFSKRAQNAHWLHSAYNTICIWEKLTVNTHWSSNSVLFKIMILYFIINLIFFHKYWRISMGFFLSIQSENVRVYMNEYYIYVMSLNFVYTMTYKNFTLKLKKYAKWKHSNENVFV